MPSSATSRLRLEKMAAGENLNSWGDPHLNTNFDLIEAAIAGFSIIPLTADYTLTTANFASDEARSAMLKFTGAGPFTVTIPSVSKQYLAWNACTANVTLTTGAGTTVVIEAGSKVAVFCDASNVSELGYAGLGLKAYIDAAALSATGSLPAATGNEGKALFVTSGVWGPRFAASTDLSDLSSFIAAREDFSLVMALIF